MFGIVNKPQFDLEKFTPGYPVILKNKRGINGAYEIQKANALTCEVNPLKLTFNVVGNDNGEPYCMDVIVNINQVLNKEYEIIPLIEDEE